MKINRNDPCTCGSGKKYKKCCLLIEEAKEQKELQEWQEWFKLDQDEGQKNIIEYENKLREKGILV